MADDHQRPTASGVEAAGGRDPVAAQVADALVLIEAGRLPEARRLLGQLLRAQGGHPQLFYGLGMLAAAGEQREEAARLLARAVEADPTFIAAQYHLAVTLKALGQVAGMVDAFRQVISQGQADDPRVALAQEALQALKETLRDAGGVEVEDYLSAYQSFELGLKLMQREHWEAAIQSFQATLEINPAHAQTWGNIGLCHSRLGKKEEAVAALDRALELEPDYALARSNREVILSMPEERRYPTAQEFAKYHKELGTKPS